MIRSRLTFQEFKDNYISDPIGGWYTVYTELEENSDGVYLNAIKLDMICEWRMTDLRPRFIVVDFETVDQFNEIITYLLVTSTILHRNIIDNITTVQKDYRNI